MTHASENGKCGCFCHCMTGALTILFGLTFLLGALGVLGAHVVQIIWPILVILFGLRLMCNKACKCCGSEAGSCETKK